MDSIRGSFLLLFVAGYLFNCVLLQCPLSEPPATKCFSKDDFDNAIDVARKLILEMESSLLSNMNVTGMKITEEDAGFRHFHTGHIEPDIIEDQQAAAIVSQAKQLLMTQFNLTNSQLKKCLDSSSGVLDISDFCRLKQPSCTFETTSYYRTDGSCNNKKNPMFGSVGTPMIRKLDDEFEDGIENLPGFRLFESVRQESVFTDTAKGHAEFSLPDTNNDLSSILGQVFTHEIMMTKKAQLTPHEDKGGFNCCTKDDNPLMKSLIKTNKYCQPIDVPATDLKFKGKVKCLNYIKSVKGLDNCKLDKSPMPINFHTPYIDAELIYNPLSLAFLAENGWKFPITNLKMMHDLLVLYDERSQQLPQLFMYLNLFTKLNNLLIEEFKILKPKMSIDAIFQEVRKIVTAIYQKIFVDFVINLIPPIASDMFSLSSQSNCYDANIDPQVSLESNLALRFFHWFLKPTLGTYDEKLFKVPNGLRGKKSMDIPFKMMLDNLTWYDTNVCGIMHGLLDSSWNVGVLSDDIHNQFFSAPNAKLGMDLRSMDFQTGRENGEPSYCTVLRIFHGVSASCNDEIKKKHFFLHDSAQIEFFEKHYKNLCDISYSIGADLEIRDAAPVGTTNGIFIAEQTHRSMCGDRFYFNNAAFFREDQKNRIRNFDLGTLICLINDCNNTRLQANAFMSPGPGNLKRICPTRKDIMSILNLNSWLK